MSDLIDREKAINTVNTMTERCTTGDIIDLRDMICESLAVLPTADTDISEYSDRLWKLAYERGKTEGIVRCKDCVRWNTIFDRTKAEYGLCQIRSQLEATKNDDFCSRGERRTDE